MPQMSPLSWQLLIMMTATLMIWIQSVESVTQLTKPKSSLQNINVSFKKWLW